MRKIDQLYRYPVKGLSAEALESVQLEAGRAFPLDRVYAITNGQWRFEPGSLKPHPKARFLVLMQHEALAGLQTQLDEQHVLTVRDAQTRTLWLTAPLNEEAGRERAAAFFKSFLGEQKVAQLPEVLHRESHPFTDVSVVSPELMHSISLINLASLREVEKALGKTLHPLRFRANIYFEGLRPWEEFEWLDKEIQIGPLRAKVNFRTRRCPATDVNPQTAQRDTALPQFLRATFGHGDLGVYAQTLEGGVLRRGDSLVIDAAS